MTLPTVSSSTFICPFPNILSQSTSSMNLILNQYAFTTVQNLSSKIHHRVPTCFTSLYTTSFNKIALCSCNDSLSTRVLAMERIMGEVCHVCSSNALTLIVCCVQPLLPLDLLQNQFVVVLSVDYHNPLSIPTLDTLPALPVRASSMFSCEGTGCTNEH